MAKTSKQVGKTGKPDPEKTTGKTTGWTTGKTTGKAAPKPTPNATAKPAEKTTTAPKPPARKAKPASASQTNTVTSAKDTKPDAKTTHPPTRAEQADQRSRQNDQPTPAPVEARKSGFSPALIGGFLAACLGFLAARSDILDPVLPASLKAPDFEAAQAELQAQDQQHALNLASLKTELAAIDQPDLAPLEAQLAAIQAENAALKTTLETREAHLRDLEARFDPLDSRLTALEKQPMQDGASEAAIAAYDRELEALHTAIAAQRADVENLISEARATEAEARASEANAAIAARDAKTQTTMTRLITTLSDGAPYAQVLGELSATGLTVPGVLSASADTGVASLGALGEAFPKAARAALSAARDEAGESGGIAGFFQKQLGARSVEPRDGDDPDAILSRAEAALGDGRLDQALKELTALPDVARPMMQDWVDAATIRMNTLQAADELAQSLNNN